MPDARAVALRAMPRGTDHVLALSICLGAMGDLGIDPRNGTYSWQRIGEQLPRFRAPTAKALYADMIDALRTRQRQSDLPNDHEPFWKGE